MATKRNKRTVAPKTNTRKRRKPVRKTTSRKTGSHSITRAFLPVFLSACFIAGVGFLVLMGYRTVTASEFFDVKKVNIHGTDRASKDDIGKIIESQTSKTGVWNADLADVRSKIEKLTFVRSATVSRVLPNGIEVNVIEKKPEAIASLSSGKFLVDADGEIIAAASANEDQLPVVIKGWDESKGEKAMKENLQRLRLYKKMISQWNDFQLVGRVKEVDLADIQEPKATIQDSGVNIPVSLPKDDFGKGLKAALEAAAGKGNKIKSVNAAGVYPIIEYAGY